jgi:hypothetical protein
MYAPSAIAAISMSVGSLPSPWPGLLIVGPMSSSKRDDRKRQTNPPSVLWLRWRRMGYPPQLHNATWLGPTVMPQCDSASVRKYWFIVKRHPLTELVDQFTCSHFSPFLRRAPSARCCGRGTPFDRPPDFVIACNRRTRIR